MLAPPDAIMRAVREVTVREIARISLAPDEPALNALLRRGFEELASAPREIVIGRSRPESVRVVMDFRVDTTRLAMSVVKTETRVSVSDEKMRRRFALYWWTIRLGSGLIRRMWLRAIRRRAEKIGS
ncbi:MAG TPA: hypothetical protein VG454_00430 [Gemmatimonadales bacterium]|nr:hypothetical protein [Gemmatimonadales bacterium]